MTVLVFLSAATWAWVVAAHFRGTAHHLNISCRIGCDCPALGCHISVRIELGRLLVGCNRRCLNMAGLLRIPLHPHIYNLADNHLADIIYHLVKDIKALKLVLKERVLLTVSTEVYSLTQCIQVLKMLLPLDINKTEIFHPGKHIEVLYSYLGSFIIHLAIDVIQDSLLKFRQSLRL